MQHHTTTTTDANSPRKGTLLKSAILASAALLTLGVLSIGPLVSAIGDEAPAAPTPDALRSLYERPIAEWPAAHWRDGVAPEDRRELGLVPDVTHPEDNPHSFEKVELGRTLFWDARLSGSRGVACVSCHHPDLGWTDGKAQSQGHQLQRSSRNAPTILGVAHLSSLMHDGRSLSLEEQALLPLANEKEMHSDFDTVVESLRAIPEYRARFKEVFGDDEITLDRITKALACFQRTLNPGRSRFDSFLRGKHTALSDQEIRGLHLFRTKANCISCHSGPLMSDDKFHNIGLSFYGRKFEDLGRYHITKDPKDVGAFRTPTLRNITRTGPYMHNGLFDLPGVINLYNGGGARPRPREDQKNDPLFPTTSSLLEPLNLTDSEKQDILAFLESLEEPRLRVSPPPLPGIDPPRPNRSAREEDAAP